MNDDELMAIDQWQEVPLDEKLDRLMLAIIELGKANDRLHMEHSGFLDVFAQSMQNINDRFALVEKTGKGTEDDQAPPV